MGELLHEGHDLREVEFWFLSECLHAKSTFFIFCFTSSFFKSFPVLCAGYFLSNEQRRDHGLTDVGTGDGGIDALACHVAEVTVKELGRLGAEFDDVVFLAEV